MIHIPNETLAFVNLFQGDRHFAAIDPRGSMPVQDTKDLSELQDLSDGGFNIYYCPNQISGKRRDANVTRVRAVWIDDDKGTVNVNELPIPPSITVSTSPGKFQYLWLTDTDDVDLASSIVLGLAQKYDTDTSVHNPSRILRLPGFKNYKYKDHPIVTFVLHNPRVIQWSTIVDLFPCAGPKETKTKETDEKFSFRDCVNKILTGENVHESRIKLALHCANINMKRSDVYELLESLVADAMAAGTVNPQRGLERLANMKQAVDSAYAKIEREGPILVTPEYEHEGDKFTVIPPLPKGGLKEIVEAHLATMRYQSYEMAVPTAMHLIGMYGGGLYCYGTQTMSRSRVILARTGAGKNAISVFDSLIQRHLIAHNLNPYNFRCSESFNIAADVHADLCRFRVRGHFIEEAGENARSALGAKNENRAFTLKALTCGTQKPLEPKRFSNRSKGGREANEDMKPIWGICYSVLSESVPESYTQVIKDEGQFTDGLVPRQELIFVNPMKPYRNRFQVETIPDAVSKIFEALVSSFIDLKAERGDDIRNSLMFKRIDTSDIDDLVDCLEDEYVDKQNAHHQNDVEHALYSRFVEKVCGTILVQAVADAALNSQFNEIPLPKATVEHFNWAVDYHQALAKTIVSQAETGNLADPFEMCCNRVYKRMTTFGSQKFDMTFPEGVITSAWITKVLDKNNYKPAAECVDKVYRGNRVNFTRDIVRHCFESGWLVETDTRKSTTRNRETVAWKINPSIRGKAI